MKKNKKRSLNIKNKNKNQIKKVYQCLRGTPL